MLLHLKVDRVRLEKSASCLSAALCKSISSFMGLTSFQVMLKCVGAQLYIIFNIHLIWWFVFLINQFGLSIFVKKWVKIVDCHFPKPNIQPKCLILSYPRVHNPEIMSLSSQKDKIHQKVFTFKKLESENHGV